MPTCFCICIRAAQRVSVKVFVLLYINAPFELILSSLFPNLEQFNFVQGRQTGVLLKRLLISLCLQDAV
jgi:hypothetical protein